MSLLGISRKIIGVSLLLSFCIIGLLVGIINTKRYEDDAETPKYPYADITITEIRDIVAYDFKNSEFILYESEKEEFVGLLKGIVVYQLAGDKPERYLTTGTPRVTIEKVSGEIITISFGGDILVDDDVAYVCDYEQCNKISRFLYAITSTR